MAHTIYIRGIPENKMIKEVNVRAVPGLNTTISFRVPIETKATCIEVRPDPAGDKFQGQIYKWFNLTFDDGRTGWVRDDLLDFEGDLTAFGYTNFTNRTYAFAASKLLATTVPQSTTPSQPATTVTVTQADSSAKPAVSAVTVEQPIAPTVTVGATPTEQPACNAMVRRDSNANVRAAPSITSAKVDSLQPAAKFPVLGVEQGTDGQPFRWIRMVTSSGRVGYIREDLLVFSGDCSSLGLGVTDGQSSSQPSRVVNTAVNTVTATTVGLNPQFKFPSPIKASYSIFQEFGDTRFGSAHKGADLSFPAKEGTPIYASGSGIVAYTMRCTKCTEAAPNFRSQGLGDWNAQAIRDPAWGFGFGHHVVLRHAWADLPGSMRDTMATMNLSGGFAYVVYAHLSRIDVNDGAPVSAGTQIGLLGNTGNSTGAHLHLEIRLSMSANENNLFNRLTVNPRVMFEL